MYNIRDKLTYFIETDKSNKRNVILVRSASRSGQLTLFLDSGEETKITPSQELIDPKKIYFNALNSKYKIPPRTCAEILIQPDEDQS